MMKAKKRSLPKIRPILMVPLRRCGSHAIRLRLNFNSDFFSPYPLHIVDFMPLVPLYGDLNHDESYFRLTVDVLGLLAVSPVKWPGVSFEPIAFFEKIKDKPRSIHTIAWELLIETARVHKAKVVMDKSLDNIHYWRELTELYPHARFLNVVRDPRAQVSSMNRAIIHDFDSLLNAQTWVKAHDEIQKLIQTHPKSVLTIRFEDFIREEKNTLKKICDFMEIKYMPKMLQISKSEEAKRISQQSALWESNSSRPIESNVDKFKRTLSETEIRGIETLTEKYMKLYDYSRMFKGNVTITDEMWIQAKEKSESEKKKAWEKLRLEKPQDYILRKHRAAYIEMCRQKLSLK